MKIPDGLVLKKMSKNLTANMECNIKKHWPTIHNQMEKRRSPIEHYGQSRS